MERPRKNFIQRVRPMSLLMAAALISQPWWFKLYIAYQLTPATWLLYAGSLVLGLGVLAASYWHDARIARDPHLIDVPYLVIVGVAIAAGLALMTWYVPIYTHGRLALQRGAMEQVANGGDACPASTRCVRDGEQVFFIWGAQSNIRSGVCYDAAGEVLQLVAATRAALAADQDLTPQKFGGAMTRAEALGGQWYRCSIRAMP